jgi:hypothetical protein
VTYGQIKFRLTKQFPGVDADVLEGFITDCYQEILGVLPWKRLDVQSVLITTAPYTAGTVAVTQGSAAIVLTGGAWTAGMTGLAFHAIGDTAEYQFTFGSSGAATLDRVYEGTSNAAACYSIYQEVYPMPADCRFLDEDAFALCGLGLVKGLATEYGQAGAAAVGYSTGPPMLWWPYMDDGSTPAQIQVRLFPIPDQAYTIPFTYCQEQSSPGTTSVVLQAWLQPAALIEGSTAKIKRHLKDYPGAQAAKAAAGDALAVMCAQESYRRGPVSVQLGGYYTGYRAKRWMR